MFFHGKSSNKIRYSIFYYYFCNPKMLIKEDAADKATN